ncbi:MAG: hypothetical protein NT171_20200, partial [Planctomycetota bacterium]|nr:hypothetical protein [Planctomycetota bacterium]
AAPRRGEVDQASQAPTGAEVGPTASSPGLTPAFLAPARGWVWWAHTAMEHGPEAKAFASLMN